MRPRYQRNPPLGPKLQYGQKMCDEISGERSYRGLMTVNEDGYLVKTTDRRTYDRRYDREDLDGRGRI